jgi:uncharacterized protein
MTRFLLASLFLILGSGLASADVTVTGSGKVTYAPDQATISAGVSSEAVTAQEAWLKNADVVKKLFAALAARGIDPQDLQTMNINVAPKYTYPKDKEPVLVGYVVSYDLNVTVHKLDQLGAVLDDLVSAGANRKMNVRFASSDVEKLVDEARAKAAADARKKAQTYTSALGVHLGRVTKISDTPEFVLRSHQIDLEMMAPKAAADRLQIAAGRQEVSVNVTIVFAIAND